MGKIINMKAVILDAAGRIAGLVHRDVLVGGERSEMVRTETLTCSAVFKTWVTPASFR